MKKKVILVLLLLLAAFTLGCAAPAKDIQSQEDVSRAVMNISQDVEDVSSTLEEIDQKLG